MGLRVVSQSQKIASDEARLYRRSGVARSFRLIWNLMASSQTDPFTLLLLILQKHCHPFGMRKS
jgi:hypothetical protein